MKRCPQKSHKGNTGGAGREGVVGGTVGSLTFKSRGF